MAFDSFFSALKNATNNRVQELNSKLNDLDAEASKIVATRDSLIEESRKLRTELRIATEGYNTFIASGGNEELVTLEFEEARASFEAENEQYQAVIKELNIQLRDMLYDARGIAEKIDILGAKPVIDLSDNRIGKKASVPASPVKMFEQRMTATQARQVANQHVTKPVVQDSITNDTVGAAIVEQEEMSGAPTAEQLAELARQFKVSELTPAQAKRAEAKARTKGRK